MRNWHLIYTKPKNEDFVEQKLQLAGFEVLNTKLKQRRYLRRRLQDAVSPLFPCYLFARFDKLNDYRLIKYTRGIKKIVGGEGLPTVVPDEIINSILEREEQGVITVMPPSFEPGEEVLIKDGPFQDFEAVFQKEIKGVERVCILLKAINARLIVDGYTLTKNQPMVRGSVSYQ